MHKYKEAILYIIFIIIGFAYSIMTIRPAIIKVIDIEKGIREKSVQVADLERKRETLKAAEMEKNTFSDQVKNIYKSEASGADAESSFTVVFDDVINMAKYNGIKIYSIEYVYNPPEDEFIKSAADKINVCSLNMQIIADYSDLESFLKELYKYPYLININKIELTPYPKNKKILMSILQLKLYSFK